MLSLPSTTFSHGTGQDYDMAEYEVLGLSEWDSRESPSQAVSPSEPEPAAVTPPLTSQSSPTSTPSPTAPAPEQPEEVGKGAQTASSSPQLRLIKRKAPEVYASSAQLRPDSNGALRVIYSPIH